MFLIPVKVFASFCMFNSVRSEYWGPLMKLLCCLFLFISTERICNWEVICFHLFFWGDLLLSWIATKTTVSTVVFNLSGFFSFFKSRIAEMASNQDLLSQVNWSYSSSFLSKWLVLVGTKDFYFVFQQKCCLISIEI